MDIPMNKGNWANLPQNTFT